MFLSQKFLIVCIILFLGCSSNVKLVDLSWYKEYSRNKLVAAEESLKKYIEKHPRDISSLCYYGETLKRLRKYHAADSIVKIILNHDGCNSFAYSIRADISNPQYSGNSPYANEDSSYFYYCKAIECDSSNGSVLQSLWIKSMRAGDTQIERYTLTRLFDMKYFSKSTIELARFFLRDLPKNAVLFTSGDLDTYPLHILQTVENFRTDVVIVNTRMINMKWYFKLVCKRNNIPLGFTIDEFDKLNHYWNHNNTFIYISHQLINRWGELVSNNLFPRPVCFAHTIDIKILEPFKGRYARQGAYYRLFQYAVDSIGNLDTIFNSLNQLNISELKDPPCSDFVVSPVILNNCKNRDFIDNNITNIAFHAAINYSRNSQEKLALDVLDWIDKYLLEVNGKEELFELSALCRTAIEKRK